MFFAISAKQFLPKTTHNLSDYLGSIEDTHFPTIAEKHEIAKQHSAMTWHKLVEATEETRGHMNRGALNIVEKIQEVTGLKLRETLALADEAKQHAEEKVAEAQGVVKEVTEEVKASVSQKVEEVKEAVKEVEKEVEQDSTPVDAEKREEK